LIYFIVAIAAVKLTLIKVKQDIQFMVLLMRELTDRTTECIFTGTVFSGCKVSFKFF
jgi:hypothetical protein